MTFSPTQPAHIAIVMDGNGRWASQRHLPVSAGHKAGVETVRRLLEACEQQGVRVLTLFAFSSENWSRPALEVKALMTLFSAYLDKEVKTLHEKNICLRFIGRRDRFPAALLRKIQSAEQLTAGNQGFYLNLAVDYGGQWDIAQAARELALQVEQGLLRADVIDESLLASHLALADLPAPDLLIRTSGEYRLSNFLLWQLAYAELYFSPLLWPDFDGEELARAITCFAGRQRRFGGRSTTQTGSDNA